MSRRLCKEGPRANLEPTEQRVLSHPRGYLICEVVHSPPDVELVADFKFLALGSLQSGFTRFVCAGFDRMSNNLRLSNRELGIDYLRNPQEDNIDQRGSAPEDASRVRS